jgi:hypothetical protein
MSMWMENPSKYGPAAGPIFQTLYQQPGVFANVFGNNYGTYAGGLASTGKSFADAFGSYGAGMGSIATARANERSNMYGANAMAEAARQDALANVASAGLGAFGSASNSALNAWAANQQAFNAAAAGMHQANAQGLSNYGVSQNNALGGMSGAYGGIGAAQLASDAVGNIDFSMGGGGGGRGFTSSGPTGTIASGSYGGDGGMRFSGSGRRSSAGTGSSAALAGLNGLSAAITGSAIPGQLSALAAAGRNQLGAQHDSSREMPQQMLGQTLSGLMSLSGPAYQQSQKGMDQFYANTQFDERPYSSMLGQLGGGYANAGRQIERVQRDLGRGFRESNSGVRGLWDDSLGRLPEFMTPAQREIANREGTRQRAITRDMRRMDHLTRLADNPALTPGRRNWYTSAADRVRRSLGTF